jgi:hypothetical protein
MHLVDELTDVQCCKLGTSFSIGVQLNSASVPNFVLVVREQTKCRRDGKPHKEQEA